MLPKVEDLCSVKIEQNPASLKFLNSPTNEDDINAQNNELSIKNSLFIVGTYQIPENGKKMIIFIFIFQSTFFKVPLMA